MVSDWLRLEKTLDKFRNELKLAKTKTFSYNTWLVLIRIKVILLCWSFELKSRWQSAEMSDLKIDIEVLTALVNEFKPDKLTRPQEIKKT